MLEQFIERQFKIELLEKDKNHRLSFLKLKYSYNYPWICRILDNSNSNAIFQKWVYGNALPKKVNEIGSSNIIVEEGKIKEEINWILLSLRKFKNEINKFIKYKALFESSLIRGDYDKAEEILNLIDSEVSISLWSIESRFLIIEQKKGLKENTNFLSDLNNSSTKNYLIHLAHFYSTKAEKELSVNRYEVNVLKLLYPLIEKGYNADVEFYFSKLNPFANLKYEHLSEILAFEGYNSVIDRYLTLVSVFKMLILNLNQEDAELKEFISNRLFYIDKKIDDKQLKILRYLVEPNHEELKFDEIDYYLLNILDLYTSGNYANCQLEIEKAIESYPLVIELYVIYVKSLIQQGKVYTRKTKNSIQDTLIATFFELFEKYKNPVESEITLKKLAYNLSQFSNLSFFIFDCIRSEIYNDNTFRDLAIINTSFFNPKLSQIKGKYSNIKDFFRPYKGQSSTVQLLELVSNKEIEDYESFDIEDFRIKKYKALKYQNLSDFVTAASIWEKLLESNIVPYEEETSLINLFFCKANLNELDFCINIFVKYYFKNKYLIQKLNVELVKDLIKKEKYRNINHTLELPLFFFLTNSEGYDTHTAYECYLLSHNFEKPSDLISVTTVYNERLIFFLKNICSLETFKHSPFITSTKSKLNERIAICQLLKEKDPENIDEYANEETLLSKRLIIQKGLQEIDESKIYVNQDSIILNELKDLKSIFNRYVSIAELSNEKGISFINLGSEKVYNMSLTEKDTENIAFSKDPQYDIFKEMFYEIRDKFLYSKYGFKLNFSSRIRHGVLEGEIRSEFAYLHLITEKEKGTNSYKQNNYWKDDILRLNDSERNKTFDTLMSKFSATIDGYIYDEILAKYLLIKTEKENLEGWLDYEFDEVKLQVLYSFVYKKIINYNEFVDLIFKELWNRTMKNLEIIKSNIQVSFKEKFFKAIQILEFSLQESSIIVPEELSNNLTEIKTRIDKKLTKIASWFTITDSQISDFDFNKIIEVCCESLHSYHTSKHLVLQKDIAFCEQIKGKYYTHLVDLLRIFFQNILDYTIEENVTAEITVSNSLDHLNITIINDLRNDEDILRLTEKIQIENDIYKSQLDKRSGLYKALNNIKTNFDDETNELRLEIKDNKFCVFIKLNLNELIA